MTPRRQLRTQLASPRLASASAGVPQRTSGVWRRQEVCNRPVLVGRAAGTVSRRHTAPLGELVRGRGCAGLGWAVLVAGKTTRFGHGAAGAALALQTGVAKPSGPQVLGPWERERPRGGNGRCYAPWTVLLGLKEHRLTPTPEPRQNCPRQRRGASLSKRPVQRGRLAPTHTKPVSTEP